MDYSRVNCTNPKTEIQIQLNKIPIFSLIKQIFLFCYLLTVNWFSYKLPTTKYRGTKT